MKISSKDFKNNEEMPEKFTADGENVNPELVIEDIPEDASSLVLIVDDPDAKRVCGFTWIHWVVFNIPAHSGGIVIKEDSIPGTPGDSSYHKEEYMGPNPPAGSGVHNYYFKVFAIKDTLEMDKMTTLNHIHNKMKDQIIDKCEMKATYTRD